MLSLAYNQATWSRLPPSAIQSKEGERRPKLNMKDIFFNE